MCRRIVVLLAVLLLFLQATAGAAQLPPNRLGRSDVDTLPTVGTNTIYSPGGPVEAKELARAMFEAAQADPNKLAQKKVQAGRELVEARFEQFRVGKITSEFVLDACRLQLDAELAVTTDPARRADILLRQWAVARENALIARVRFEIGNGQITDFADTRRALADVEIALHQAAPLSANGPAVLILDLGWESLAFARDLFSLSQGSDLPKLLRTRRAAAREQFEARFQQFRVGKITSECLLEASRHLSKAELALSANEQERLAILILDWAYAHDGELISRVRYEIGSGQLTDLTATSCDLFDAQLALLRAWTEDKAARAWALPWLGNDALVDNDLWSPPRALAADLFAALQSSEKLLRRQKVAFALRGEEERMQDYRVGKITAEFALEASQRLLAAELAVAQDQAARVAAHERHWQRAWEAEIIARTRWEVGTGQITDATSTSYARLEAQIGWLRARSAPEQR